MHANALRSAVAPGLRLRATTTTPRRVPPTNAVVSRAGLHTTVPRSVASHSYNDDESVPPYYVQRKLAAATQKPSTDTVVLEDLASMAAAATEEGGGNGGNIPGIVASTKRFKAKIPSELRDPVAPDVLIHPSGFVVPTPGPAPASLAERFQRQSDPSKETAAVAERVSEEQGLAQVDATTMHVRKAKIPFEVRREDGIFVHPSGFVPPTAAKEFSERSWDAVVDGTEGGAVHSQAK